MLQKTNNMASKIPDKDEEKSRSANASVYEAIGTPFKPRCLYIYYIYLLFIDQGRKILKSKKIPFHHKA